MSYSFPIKQTNNERLAEHGKIHFERKKFLEPVSLIKLSAPKKGEWFKLHNYDFDFSDVTGLKEVDETILEKNKTVGGTVGGAVVGTLILGPFGGLVGALAGGNKKVEKKKSSLWAIEFNKKDWVIFEMKNNMLNRALIEDFRKSFKNFFEEEKKNPFS